MRDRYSVLSFTVVGLAGDSFLMNILTNGLMLPLFAACIRTTGLTVAFPVMVRNMVNVGQPQNEIEAALGNAALAFEVVLALPAVVLLMKNPSIEAAITSAAILLAVEVAGKHAYLAYFRLRDGAIQSPSAERSTP